MKHLFLTLSISFILNLIWEHLHAPLYLNYKGGVITDFILFRAALGDMVLVTVLLAPAYLLRFKQYKMLIAPLGLFVATLIEYLGLMTMRWAYNSSMPIVPILQIGLTPFVQLAVTGLITYILVLKVYKL